MNAAAELKEPSNFAQWVVLLAAPTFCLVLAAVFAPAPQAVAQARAAQDRADVADIVATAPPTPRTKIGAELGSRVRLVGADLPTKPLGRGERFAIKTYWETLKEMDRTWKMFVHVDLKTGRSRIHGDHLPTDNRYPTPLWQKGEFVTDIWKHRVPLDAAKGEYDVFVGFYIGDERMRFSGGDKAHHAGENRLKIGSLRVQ